MDPLSITASTLAFIGACRKLVAGFRFLKDLSRAPEEILALTDELNDLHNTLTAVHLVTRRHQDKLVGLLLTPLFVKVDGIIYELCDFCGACPQRMKEDGDYLEDLKLQLLARFKWTRAKNRVGELRERLKVLRLDFANSLAAIGLLDISNLTLQLDNLSKEILNKTTVSKTIEPNNPPPYKPSIMQVPIYSDSDSKSVDLEAQEQQIISQRSAGPKGQSSRRYDQQVRQCKKACSCVCHSVYRVKSPSVLRSLVGSLLVKSNGLYGLTQACNEFTCGRNSSVSVRISYRFPEWLLNRMVSTIIISNQVSGPQLSLVTPRVVSHISEIFGHAFQGNIDAVAKVFQLGLASPCDISSSYGYTPLHYAVDNGHMDLCRFLLNAGARASITDFAENSVNDLAWNKICSRKTSRQEAAALEELFNKDDWLEERQFSTLHKIILDLLPVSRTLDYELQISTRDLDLADSEGRTPLSWAAELGSVAALKTLLDYDANPNSTSAQGMTPLHYATKAPNADCIPLLLSAGASPFAKNIWKQSPLNFASYHQNSPAYILPLLTTTTDDGNGVSIINDWDSMHSTPLSCATWMNNSCTAQCLIAHGADINNRAQRLGNTVLNDAIENNSYECISLLLDHGADISIADHVGETALHVLARRADMRTLGIFQDAAATTTPAAGLEDLDPEAKSKDGLTARELLARRVDCDEGLESAFEVLMARLDQKNGVCEMVFDAMEKVPAFAGASKLPDLIHVSIEEIVIN